MNTDNGRLNFTSSIDNTQSKKGADELARIFQNIGKSAEKYGINIDKYIGGGLRSSGDAAKAFKGIADELKAKIQTQASVVQSLSLQYKEASDAVKNAVMASERQKNTASALKKELQAEREELATMKQLLAQVNEQQQATGGSATSMKARLRELRGVISGLEMQWRSMTDEERKSDMGVALKKQIDAAKKEASDLADVMADVKREITSGANDTGKFSALSEGINLAVSSATALTGALELLGVSGEEAEKVQAEIQSGLAISNALVQAQNVLQKESNLMVQIGNIQRWAQAKADAAATAAKNAGTLATIKATVAQKAFNLVANANPYVLLATAIVTVVGALYLFSRHNDDAKRRQEELNAEIERGKKVQEAYDGAFVDSATESHAAMQKLRTQWNALGNDLEAKKKFIKTNQDAFHDLGLAINSTSDAEDFFNSQKKLQAFNNAMISRARAMGAAAAAAEKYKQAFEIDSQPVKAGKRWKEVDYNTYKKAPSYKRREDKGVKYDEEGGYESYLTYYIIDDKAQEKAFADQRKKNKQKSDKLRKDGDNLVKQQVENEKKAQAYLKNTGNAYSGGGKSGSSSRGGKTPRTTTDKKGDEKTESEKWLEEWKKRIEEADELRDLVYRKREELLATESDASKKRREQLQLDYDKEISDLNKQQRQMAEKNKEEALKKNKNADVSNIGLTQDQQKQLNAVREAIQARYKYEREQIDKEEKESAQSALDAYNREYGDYMQKRIAIQNEMQREIDAATNEGERKTAEAKGKQELQDLDFEQFKKNINWEAVFGDLSSISESSLNVLKAQLQKIIATTDGSNVEMIKTVKEALDSVTNEIGKRDPFKGITKSVKDYIKSLTSLHTKQKALVKVNDEQLYGEESIGEAYQNAVTAMDEKTIADIKNTEVCVTYTDAQGNLTTEVMKYVDLLKDVTNAENDNTNTKAKLTARFKEIGGALSNIGAVGKNATNLLDEFGVKVPESVGKVFDSFGTLGKALEGFDLTKPGSLLDINNYITFATGIVGAFKGIGETIAGVFFGGGFNWDEYNKMMERYKSLNDTWDRLISKKKEYISEGYGKEADAVENDTERLIRQQTEAARKMGEAWVNAGRSWKSHSQGYELNKSMSDEASRQAQQAFGNDWQTGILNMSSEELKKLYEDPTMANFWAELKQYGGDFYDIIMKIVNEKDNLESVTDTLNKSLTFKSFDDLESSFSDMLADMEKDSKDFSEDMEKNFQNAIIRTFIYSKYQSRLKAFYERWADAMKGDLNAGELETLRNEYQGIVNDAITERNQIADALGFKDTGTDQNSTSGGFQTMSQDTADELNGRFTAIQMDVAQVRQMMDEMRGISLNNMGYLEDISKNTFQLYEMNERLGKIEQYTSRL